MPKIPGGRGITRVEPAWASWDVLSQSGLLSCGGEEERLIEEDSVELEPCRF